MKQHFRTLKRKVEDNSLVDWVAHFIFQSSNHCRKWIRLDGKKKKEKKVWYLESLWKGRENGDQTIIKGLLALDQLILDFLFVYQVSVKSISVDY